MRIRLLAFIASMIISSCNTEDTCDVPCVFGTCINNSCNCSFGYEGDSCSVRTVDKYIGSWNGVDSCDTNNWGYTATIAASSVLLNQIIISNFGRFGTTFTVVADVTGFTFTIPDQEVQGIKLSGSGAIDTVIQQISVTYSATDAFGSMDHCSGVWTKEE